MEKKNCFRLRFYTNNGAKVTCFLLLFFLSWLVLQFYHVLPPVFFLPGSCFSPKGANYSQLAKARGFCSPFCFSQRLGVEDFTSRPAATHPAGDGLDAPNSQGSRTTYVSNQKMRREKPVEVLVVNIPLVTS